MKQSRFKEIIREELALSRVGKRLVNEASSDYASASRQLTAANDALINAWHQIGDAMELVARVSEDEAAQIDDVYEAVREQVTRLGATLRRLRKDTGA